ncbi:MAG: bifunctional 4-hydroxy-2-oxoglutarate aldolase/2-dehydro-3-deoxy-phosphogluconate aldolase [Candidatus Omnitrophica bacterium]|nr:bifunctional 4-hydroxy-2-oxoglutarate aldolase/2-dehydro-3-deoxy-phosphogluconate aldolase [Candidatus Omnitrophota bacterium]
MPKDRTKMDLEKFKQLPLMGILRGASREVIEPLVETVVASGLTTLEITMNTEGAAELIKKAGKKAAGRLTIGAGTVLNMEDLKSSLDAGATFIVMPVVINDVCAHCFKNKIPFFPGALSPQEIYTGWSLGAAMVKVFPAKCFGPEYFREIKGPFNDIKLLACGGVTPENLKEYFSCGAEAVTFGASVFRKEWLACKDYKSIGLAVSRFVEKVKSIKD